MLYIGTEHDPDKNAQILSDLLNNKDDIRTVLEDTDRLFRKKYINHENSYGSFIKNISVFLFAEKTTPNTLSFNAFVGSDGHVYPEWKMQLDDEYAELQRNIKKEVNIEDFGAVGDGITDNTEAFKRALGKSRVKVHVPKGIFVTKEIRLPSWTILVGEGKGVTAIKLHDDAPVSARLVTNANHWRGNHHILVKDMTLDWNVERLGNLEKTSAGGNHSSCLTYAHVTYGWVQNVEAINPGLHCFDITSTHYNYSGDGYRARRGSKFIWLDHLNGYGFGDDGMTTHHSEYVFISNSHMCDPSGRAHQKGNSNSNGIEIDDGSKNILLVNNSTSRCFGGVEIKAHEDSSAASNVQIVGHLSVSDNRSFNFRHIGHHKASDSESKTAFNIKATNIVAIAPVFSELYKESQPRALVVSAYRNVVINNFSVIGDPEYDYKNNPVIAVQYRARNVVLHNLNIKNFVKAGADLKIFGGPQRAEFVYLQDIVINDSAKQAIDIGAGIENIRVQHVRAIGKGRKIGLGSSTSSIEISDFQADGYETPIRIT